MFDEIRQLKVNMSKITAASVLDILINQTKFQDLIIRLNTEEQLFKKGIDSEGETLGIYAEFTIKQKQKKGQPTAHVTLKDTGDFYGTWTVTTNNGDIFIEADGDKPDKNLMDVYGEEIVGLLESNLQILIDEIETDTPEIVENLLLTGTA